MRVSEVMTVPAIAISPDASVQELLDLWKEHPYGGFPVVQDGTVLGVVSEADLVWRDRPLKAPHFFTLLDAIIPIESPRFVVDEIRKTVGARVRDIMTAPAIVIRPEADVAEAASLMTERRIDRLPVVDEVGKLVGIVSRTDLVRTLT